LIDHGRDTELQQDKDQKQSQQQTTENVSVLLPFSFGGLLVISLLLFAPTHGGLGFPRQVLSRASVVALRRERLVCEGGVIRQRVTAVGGARPDRFVMGRRRQSPGAD
jgi:hypothetical protein